MLPVKDLRSKAALDEAMAVKGSVVIHFWASWCQASSQMNSVFAQLCTDTPHARFFQVESEKEPEISETFQVAAVPFFVFIKDGRVVDKLEGANPAELANKVARLAGPSSLYKAAAPASLGMAAGPAVLEAVQDLAKGDGATEIDPLRLRIQGLVDAKPVMLFMKGTPEQPRCGFSRRVVDVLNEHGIEYGSFDILSDEDVRQGLKSFSNWPSFPQVFCRGELLGGCDIIVDMHKSGELKQVFEQNGTDHSTGS